MRRTPLGRDTCTHAEPSCVCVCVCVCLCVCVGVCLRPNWSKTGSASPTRPIASDPFARRAGGPRGGRAGPGEDRTERLTTSAGQTKHLTSPGCSTRALPRRASRRSRRARFEPRALDQFGRPNQNFDQPRHLALLAEGLAVVEPGVSLSP